MTYSVFGFDIPVNVIISILVVNSILLIAAIVGFTNLRSQIRELTELLNKIKARQKELND
jgi:hypothetical protein